MLATDVAGNLRITSLGFADANYRPTSTPTVGQQIRLGVNWNAESLPSNATYVVRFWVDDVALTSSIMSTSDRQDGPLSWYHWGWYATPGVHTIRATVDAGGSLAESDESDNTIVSTFTTAEPTTLPQKLLSPIGGVPFRDWHVVNYLDVDPYLNHATDFRGGPITYDGHDGYDFSLPGFARMDAGVPVFAAADGVVTEVNDGNPDRETRRGSRPANDIRIDHGDGWSTAYYHLAISSTAVKPGQKVLAGQLIGMVGSSGDSSGPHLHFGLYHNGLPVETYFEPAAYWADPLPYEGDVPTTAVDHGIGAFDASVEDMPAPLTEYAVLEGATPHVWTILSHLRPGDTLDVHWYPPDGTLATPVGKVTSFAAPVDLRLYLLKWQIDPATLSSSTGTWSVATSLNGVEIDRQAFRVTTISTKTLFTSFDPSYSDLGPITSPVEFRAYPRETVEREVSITNNGPTTIHLSDPSLPPGFSLDRPFPTTLAPEEVGTLSIAYDAAGSIPRSGEAVFHTDDPTRPVIRIPLSGIVVYRNGTVHDPLVFKTSALAISQGSPPVVIDNQASLNRKYPNWNDGTLAVQLSGGGLDDRLAIRDEGSGPGMIGLQGSVLTLGGKRIGTVEGGTGTTSLTVRLDPDAPPGSAVALLRSVTYANLSTTPDTATRTVTFTFIETGGEISVASRKIINSGRALTPQALDAGGPYLVREGEGLALAGIGPDNVGGGPAYS